MMVFCGNLDKWKAVWAHAPKVKVTNDTRTFKEYLTHYNYVKEGDTFLPMAEGGWKINPPKTVAQLENNPQIWYYYRVKEHGVVYGSSGNGGLHQYVEGKLAKD